MSPPASRTVLVTGAAGKLGRPIVENLLRRGDRVVFVTRRAETAAAFSAGLPPDSQDRVVGVVADLEKPQAADELAGELAARKIAPDAFVHAARNPAHLAVDTDGDPARAGWMGEYLLSVVAPYELAMALTRAADRRLSSIVLLSSMYGAAAPNPALYGDGTEALLRMRPQYGVAKAATIHLVKYLSVLLAPAGVRVNCVSYGGVAGREDPAFIERYAALCPQRRMLDEADAPGPVLFLTSPDSHGVTGHNLMVDGGWTVW